MVGQTNRSDDNVMEHDKLKRITQRQNYSRMVPNGKSKWKKRKKHVLMALTLNVIDKDVPTLLNLPLQPVLDRKANKISRF